MEFFLLLLESNASETVYEALISESDVIPTSEQSR